MNAAAPLVSPRSVLESHPSHVHRVACVVDAASPPIRISPRRTWPGRVALKQEQGQGFAVLGCDGHYIACSEARHALLASVVAVVTGHSRSLDWLPREEPLARLLSTGSHFRRLTTPFPLHFGWAACHLRHSPSASDNLTFDLLRHLCLHKLWVGTGPKPSLGTAHWL